MKPKILLHSSFLTWLRGIWVNAFTPTRKTRKRYPRTLCPGCGKAVATTTAGLWRHVCNREN